MNWKDLLTASALFGAAAYAPRIAGKGRRARGDVSRVIYGNRYGGSDPITNRYIQAGQGISVQRDGYSQWQVFDKNPAQWPPKLLDYVQNDPRAPGNHQKGKSTPTKSATPPKYLHADGTLDYPYDVDAIRIIQTAPRRRWDGARKKWILSVSAVDLPRTLEVAKQIQATVAPELLKAAAGKTSKAPGAVQVPKALQSVMRAAKKTTTAEGFKAYGYQLEGVNFLARRSHLGDPERGACALLADDMGTGKTIQCLLALPRKARAIIVVPDVVKINWAIECRRWRPDLTPTVIGKPKEYLDRLPRMGEIIILNYDRLPGLKINKATGWKPEPGGRGAKKIAGEKLLTQLYSVQATLGKNEGGKPRRLPLFLIADEAHKIKNPKAQRTQAFRVLADFSATIWLLTGTPLDNKPPDLWNILSAGRCAQEAFGWGNRGYSNFKRLFNAYDGRFGIEWGRPQPEVAEILRRIMLRRTKKQVLPQLPEKRHETIEIVPEPKDWNKIVTELDKIQVQLSNDIYNDEGIPPFDTMSTVRRMLAESRVEAVGELVESYEEAGEPVVVASAHRAPLLALKAREGWEAIMGGTPANQRQRIVEDFQAGRLKGLAIAIEAAGVGITLTRANTMIFVDLAWKPGDNAQAEDRIHRIGQTRGTLYRVMVSPHPLDKHITNLLQQKQSVVDAAIEQRMVYTPPPPPPRNASPAAKAHWGDIQAAIKDAKAGKARRKLSGKLTALKDKGFKSVSLSARQIDAMQDALAMLSSSCDYAMTRDNCGFNKPDAYTGNMLAMVGLSDPTAQQVAYGILGKYKGQIGSTWDSIYKSGARSVGRPPRTRRRW